MRSNRMLLIICSALLITNLIWVLVFVRTRRSETSLRSTKKTLSITRSLEHDVRFTKSQMEKFYLLRDSHSVKLRRLFENLSARKQELYQLLGRSNADDSLTLMKGREIGKTQTEIDLQIFRNLSEVEALCLPEQKAVFDSAIVEIIRKKWLRRDK